MLLHERLHLLLPTHPVRKSQLLGYRILMQLIQSHFHGFHDPPALGHGIRAFDDVADG